MSVILGETRQFLKEIKLILTRLKTVREYNENSMNNLIGEFEATVNKFEEYLMSMEHSPSDNCVKETTENASFSLKKQTTDTGFPHDNTPLHASSDNWTSGQVIGVEFSSLDYPTKDLPISGSNEDWAADMLTAAVGGAVTCLNPVMLVSNAASEKSNRVLPQEDLPNQHGCEILRDTDDDHLSLEYESIDFDRHRVTDDQVEKQGSNDSQLTARCPQCQKGFNRDCRLRQHVFIKHKGGVLNKQVCPFCGKSFESKYLKSHISIAHEGKETKCDICTKTFATVSALNAHRKNVHGGRRFVCHNCDKSFASKWGLEVHFGKEHEIRSYPCELCDSVFRSANLLRRHTQGVHERIRHSCHTCATSFTQKSQLKYHIKLKHSLGEDVGRLACDKCKKVFVVPFKMREHQKKCMAVLGSNVGYAHIAASLAERNELPEKT